MPLALFLSHLYIRKGVVYSAVESNGTVLTTEIEPHWPDLVVCPPFREPITATQGTESWGKDKGLTVIPLKDSWVLLTEKGTECWVTPPPMQKRYLPHLPCS